MQIIRSTSRKDQNVPRQSLYRPATFWSKVKAKTQGQGRENAQIVSSGDFVAYGPIDFNTDISVRVPIPGTRMLAYTADFFADINSYHGLKKAAAIIVDACPCRAIFVSYDDW